MNAVQENNIDLKNRTKAFAIRIIKLCRKLPDTTESRIIGKQILRSGTSIAANYRAACRARSDNEFVSKLNIVIEETDETMFWLEIISETGIIAADLLKDLYSENEEILKIMVASRLTALKREKYKH
ncbi:MAG: four helix bundle protein [Salinivirgaceae bacterium]|nr:four helix bundle protein [Salinivirgaceae bacterium]